MIFGKTQNSGVERELTGDLVPPFLNLSRECKGQIQWKIFKAQSF